MADKKQKKEIHGNNIRELLKELDMTQQELADRALDGNVSHLSRIINGRMRCVSLPIAYNISQVLGKPMEEVFICKFEDSGNF